MSSPDPILATVFEAVKRHQDAADQFFKAYGNTLAELTQRIAASFRQGGKLLLCGNGGSACDAMHIAGEFVGRFQEERAALPAIALSADAGILTAVGNDYGFEHIFSRQVEALGNPGDILIALSTSGSSKNILRALEAAKVKGVTTILMTGEKGKNKAALCDYLLAVNDADTARIQEVHKLALHILTGMVEATLKGKG